MRVCLRQSLRQWLVVQALATACGVKPGISTGQPLLGALDGTGPHLEGTESNHGGQIWLAAGRVGRSHQKFTHNICVDWKPDQGRLPKLLL